MSAEGVIEADPVPVLELLAVASVATVGEATDGGLSAHARLLVLFLESAHELLVEVLEASGCHGAHTRQEANEADEGASE
eukprot:CAMPEP_0185578848 /NCGR_PEP_ID=MMETSP0434-20130131/13182_1 /TAXON_ID=626734 ORGANISM="Favella taraikaensis, Strain Fe Narragansett Bay" /NCGR_SAMPLE_ID=MMETSP0434 /ASSEMBLY_ACC=CAM_ASM_000379 /LENGTH=79 /DNA_ID=CAMNT_0028196741 /DNA_START=381 /DNA_END=620 /DNA_ORIENTATION=-